MNGSTILAGGVGIPIICSSISAKLDLVELDLALDMNGGRTVDRAERMDREWLG